MATAAPKKFEPGAQVRILNPVIVGTVKEVSDKPGLFGEYWHTIDTKYGPLKHLGRCLERLAPDQK
jgi:hypothetical protein